MNKREKSIRKVIPCILLWSLAFAPAPLARAVDYSVTLVDAGPAYTSVYAVGINNFGQIVGNLRDLSTWIEYGFIYTRGSFMRIDTLGNTGTYVTAINDFGEVTGVFGLPTYDGGHAFIYSQGEMTDLGAFDSVNYSRGYGINAAGQVTGFSYLGTDYSTYRAFLYSDGIMKDIGTLGGTSSAGTGINASGQIVGHSWLAGDSTYHAFLYSSGTMTDLGTFGGLTSRANAINDAGQITGYADLTGDFFACHAFLYDNGKMIDLGALGEGYSYGLAINNLGQVVGYSTLTPLDLEYEQHAFLYTDGRMLDLNTLIDPDSGWILLEATGINDAGQIVGNGLFDGQYHAFLLTPTANGYDLSSVPEPATLPILALAALALIRRRRA